MSIPYKALIVDTPGNALTPEQRETAKQELGCKVDATRETERQRHPRYVVPSTFASWWSNVDEWWPELSELLSQFVAPRVILTMAEQMTGIISKPRNAGASTYAMLTQIVVKLKQDRDARLHDLFEAAWAGAPDNGSIHALEGWHVLCDLCSEAYCIYDSEVAIRPGHPDFVAAPVAETQMINGREYHVGVDVALTDEEL